MAALPGSGQISFGDIATNHGIASSNVSLKTESEALASGSVVDGSELQTTARYNLKAAPYAISEFYDADFENSQFDTVVAKYGTTTELEGFVEGETARIYVDVNQQINNTIRGGLKLKTDDSIAVVEDVGTNLAADTHYVNVTVPPGDSLVEKYYAFADVASSFKSAVGGVNLDHYDAIGAVTITDPSDSTVAASSTTRDITHARSIGDTSDLTSYAWVFATTTAGDDGGNPSPTTSASSTPTVTYTGPGTYTTNLTVYGQPTNARNSTTAAQVSHRIDYTKQITIDNPSNVNQGTSYNITGNHKGYSSGIEVDEIKASDSSVLSSNDDSADSRVVSSNGDYSRAITPSTSAGNNTLSVKAKAHGGGVTATSNAFNIFPLLTTSKNTINPTTQTIFSTTRNTDTGTYPTTFTFSSPGTRTDNITTRTYSEGSSYFNLTGDTTPSSQTGTQPGVVALTSVTSGENVTYTVTSTVAAGDSAVDQSTATTCAVTVNYSKELYSVSSVAVGGTYDTVNDSLTFSFSWQGFELGSTRYELMESSDGTTQRGSDLDKTDITGGTVRSAQASGNVALTSQVSVANGFSYTTGGSYKIKISLYSDGSQSTLVASALTSTFTTYSVTDFTSQIKGLAQDGEFIGWESKLLAAEQYGSEVTYNTAVGSGALYALNTNVGSKISNDSDLGGTYDFNQESGENFYHIGGSIYEIGSDGIIDDPITDGTPATPASITVTSGSASDTTWDIAVAGETYVARLVRIYYGTSQGSTSNNVTVNTSEQDASETMTTSALDVSSFADGDVYFSARFENDAENGATLSPDIAHAVASTAASWTSVFPNFTMEDAAFETVTSEVDLYLNNGSGTTRVHRTTSSAGITFAYKTSSGDPYSAYTTDVTFSFTSGTLYIKFYKSLPKMGSASDTFRFTNDGVSVDRVVTYEVTDEP